jgi:hypothetical protein
MEEKAPEREGGIFAQEVEGCEEGEVAAGRLCVSACSPSACQLGVAQIVLSIECRISGRYPGVVP